MRLRGSFFAGFFAAVFGLCLLPNGHAQPRVVASVVPVHSLVAGVMHGVGAPDLLVPGASSPHAYALRPSDARALSGAEVVFWIGPAYESFLRKPLTSLAGKATVVELARSPGVAVLPAREGGVWESAAHGHSHGHGHGKAQREDIDGHLYLDPANAGAIVRAAVVALSAADAANQSRYAANGEALQRRIDALDAQLRQTLEPVRGRPFVVFHDAYQYFERRYGLNALGAITVSPERAPGAQRLQSLRTRLGASKAVCVFSEPQFAPSVVRTVVEGTTARTAVLDPVGAGLTPGPDAYFELLRALGQSLAACLAE